MRYIGLIVVFILLVQPSIGRGQEEEEVYHERLEYDTETGQWVEIAPPIPGTDGGDLALARFMLARGEYEKARKAFKLWFKMYPDSALRPQGLFYSAQTEVSAEETRPKSGDLMQAYQWLEELLEGWPGTELADRALRKELIIAEMFLFKDRKQRRWGGILWLSATEEALDILNRIVDLWAPGKPIAEQALRRQADYHYLNGEFEEAELAFSRLMREFPRGKYHKIAMLRSGQSALARFPGVQFDEADLLEAEVYLNDFHETYPQEAAEYRVPQMLSRISESRAEKEYSIGRYYERTRAIDAAAYYYRWVVSQYPATTWAAEAQNRLVALGAVEPAADEADKQAAAITP
jgi:outer membrane assembly lipoprotein YfiO